MLGRCCNLEIEGLVRALRFPISLVYSNKWVGEPDKATFQACQVDNICLSSSSSHIRLSFRASLFGRENQVKFLRPEFHLQKPLVVQSWVERPTWERWNYAVALLICNLGNPKGSRQKKRIFYNHADRKGKGAGGSTHAYSQPDCFFLRLN